MEGLLCLLMGGKSVWGRPRGGEKDGRLREGRRHVSMRVGEAGILAEIGRA